MLDKIRPCWIITRREIRDQFRDWRIIIPILVLTLIFPAIMNFTAQQAIRFVEDYGATIIGERLIPFLLMVVGFFPISVSLVIALESFVGEKERRSIEPLLSTPLSNEQLYFGKLMAVLVPPLAASYLGVTVYLVGVYRQVGWTPDPTLLIQILALTAVQSLVMVSGAVVISSQATSVRAANLLASFIIIPMAFLIQGESLVMFWGRYHVLWWAIAGLAVVSALLIRTGIAHFNREELLGREYDALNVRWSLRVFVEAFRGESDSLRSWITGEIPRMLKRLVLPAALMVVLLAAAIWLGVNLADSYTLPPELLNLDGRGIVGFEEFPLFSARGAITIWVHNFRAIALATILGVFSFGVFGLMVLAIPLALVGYFMATVAAAGLAPWTFLWTFILPHGIFEIPAIVISGATILYMGARLVTPVKGQAVGEVWLRSLAIWAKIMVAVVIPLLFAAAAMEALITPQVILRFFGA